MRIATAVEIYDVLTINECIEIILAHRTGRERLTAISPAAAAMLGATHFMPRSWIDEAKDLLRRALLDGEVGLYARRAHGDPASRGDPFIKVPSEKLRSSVAFSTTLPGDVLLTRLKDGLAAFHGCEVRILRSEIVRWLSRRLKLLDRTRHRRKATRNLKLGRSDQKRMLAINVTRELFPMWRLVNKPPRQIAREVVAAMQSRYGVRVGLRTAQRAVAQLSKRRSPRR